MIAKHAHLRWVISDLNRAKSYVCWQYSAEEEHRILHEFQRALAALRTDCSDEWVVLGSSVFALVRTLDKFKELDLPEIACGLTYAGNLHRMRVYLLPIAEMQENEFIIGCYDSFARGICLGMPMLFNADPPVLVEADDDAAMDPCRINDACIAPSLQDMLNDTSKQLENLSF